MNGPRSKVERFEFTAKRLLELEPPAKRARIVYDAINPKLVAMLRASGSNAFYAVVWSSVKRRTEWIRIGSLADLTVDQARKEASKIVGKFAAGEDPPQMRRDKKRKEREAMTLGDAFNAYIDDRKVRKLKSVDDIQRTWTRCLGALPADAPKNKRLKRLKHPKGVNWQDRKLSEIAHEDVRRLHSSMSKTPYTANRVVRLLSVIHNHLRLLNPATRIKPFPEAQRSRFLRKEELPRFYAALAEETNEDFRDFVNLALLTGGRSGNVRAMRFEDIDFALAAWTIPGAASKNGEEMSIPLLPQAIEILERRKGTAGKLMSGIYVFPAIGVKGYMTPPSKKWLALIKRSKIENLRLHDLRRSMGSWQAIMGASLPVIGRSLGHRSISATAIYARLSTDPIRESMQRAAAAMMSAGDVRPGAEVVNIK
jgi:integrase